VLIHILNGNAGRSPYTWFLFAQYCLNVTWKFTPLFKFTQ